MDLPAAPANMRTQWRVDGGQVVLDMPRAGFSMSAFGSLAAMAVAATIIGASGLACFLIFIGRRADIGPGFKWLTGLPFTVACFTLPVVILFQGILWPAFCRTRVIASSGGLRVEQRLGLVQRAKAVRADELEELALTRVREPAITARGRKAAIRFGQGLPEAELEWIRAAVAKVLAK
jgi:hypothetical protein